MVELSRSVFCAEKRFFHGLPIEERVGGKVDEGLNVCL